MNDQNTISISGNLGADPELRATAGGKSVCNLRIASTQRWKDRDGNDQERTLWIGVVVWGWLAEVVSRGARKGSKVSVTGELQVREWEDRDSVKRESWEVHVGSAPGSMIWVLDMAPFRRDQNGQASGGQRSGGFGGGRGGQQQRNGGGFGGGRGGQQRQDQPPPADDQPLPHDDEDLPF